MIMRIVVQKKQQISNLELEFEVLHRLILKLTQADQANPFTLMKIVFAKHCSNSWAHRLPNLKLQVQDHDNKTKNNVNSNQNFR